MKINGKFNLIVFLLAIICFVAICVIIYLVINIVIKMYPGILEFGVISLFIMGQILETIEKNYCTRF